MIVNESKLPYHCNIVSSHTISISFIYYLKRPEAREIFVSHWSLMP